MGSFITIPLCAGYRGFRQHFVESFPAFRFLVPLEMPLTVITYLCFTNDLMVFCHADAFIIGVIKSSLDKFTKVFSLVTNLEKSNIFFSSVIEDTQIQI